MNYTFEIALFLHILGVTVWVGGMLFAHFFLRPALADLTPQIRLPLMESVLGRFFLWVGVSVLAILISGGLMMARYGAYAPWTVKAMAGVGVVMMLLFGHIRFGIFPKLRRAVQSQNWTEGALRLGKIRRWVGVNLMLGIVTIALAVFA
jgi:uncharacterized membrane protein